MTDVSAVARQRFLDQKLFHFFEAHLIQLRRGCASSPQRQVACFDVVILCHQHGALNDVVQLAHIALPRMFMHGLNGVVIEAGDVLSVSARMYSEKVSRQRS